MADNYNDIINNPHHTSKTRKRMSQSNRAAQFAPFAALTGYDAAIDLKEFSPLIENDYFDAISLDTCVNERKVYGGSAPEAMEKAFENAENFIKTI